MFMKKLFTQYLFLPLSLPLLFSIIGCVIALLNNGNVQTWGFNKTVGWAWDLTNSFYWSFFLYPVYLVVYTILALLKTKTNYTFSVIHFCLIVIPIVTMFTFPIIGLYAPFFSFLVFIINIVYSLICRFKTVKPIE